MIKITVITSVLNGQDCIEDTIRSVIDQDYPDVEYILIDGKSTDKTLAIVRKYQDKIAHIISEPDDGIYDAWNKGLKLATGEWICFIGCGDVLAENALKKFNEYIVDHPGLDFISSTIELMDDDNRKIRSIGTPWKWQRFIKYMNTIHAGALHHNSLFKTYGHFNTTFKIAGDYEMLLRAGKNLRAGFLDFPAVQMRSGGISVSSLKVFDETEKAKCMHTGKSVVICRLEKYMDIFKFFIKEILKKYFGIRYI